MPATLLQRLEGHDRDPQRVRFSPDGKLLATFSLEGGPIRLWNAATGSIQSTTEEHEEMIWDAEFSSDSKLLVSACDDGIARLWDTPTGKLLRSMKDDEEEERMFAVTFSPDGKLLATGIDIVQLWDVETGVLQRSLFGPGDRNPLQVCSPEAMWHVIQDQHEINTIAFAPDPKLLVSVSCKTRTVRLWDTDTWTLRFTSQATTLSFSPDGSMFATASHQQNTRLWNTHTLALQHTLEGSGVEFSPDGTTLATMSRDHQVRLWNPVTGELQKTLIGYGTAMPCVLFTPNSETLISNSGRIIHIWNVKTGELQFLLEEHARNINSLVLSRDGTVLASGSRDRSVRLWDVESGICLQTLEGHGDEVRGLAFSPDGTRLATAGGDAIVQLWEVTCITA